MKIGIDISMLVYRGSGVATYTFNLVKGLLSIDSTNEYHLFYSSFRRPSDFTFLKELQSLGGHVHDYPFPPRILAYWWNKHSMVPVEWFIGKVDIFHSSDFLRPPLQKGTKGITTIHDLTWKKFPEFHTQDIIDAHEKKLQETIKHNDIIITDSKQSEIDLKTFYPDIRNEIHIIPLGVDAKYFQKVSKQSVEEVKHKYKISASYLLYVGAIEPRKNLKTLVEAFAIVHKTNPELQLVLAGRAGWKNEEVYQTVEKYNLHNKVLFPGYIDEDDLPALYKGATVFVYPSLYEGYGLPPVEAIASGTPTIAFNSPSISDTFTTEISPGSLGTLIKDQIQKPTLPKVLINNWEQVAEKTLQIYCSGI